MYMLWSVTKSFALLASYLATQLIHEHDCHILDMFTDLSFPRPAILKSQKGNGNILKDWYAAN